MLMVSKKNNKCQCDISKRHQSWSKKTERMGTPRERKLKPTNCHGRRLADHF